jgi:beta-galactosidase
LATFGDDFYAGQPAVTEHHFGAGRAYYVATRPAATLVATLVGSLLKSLGITSPLSVPSGVEVTRREGSGRSFTFVLNHHVVPITVTLPEPRQDLLSGRAYERSLELPAKGVAILVPTTQTG